MATVIRIKRRSEDQPAQNIYLKKPRLDSTDAETDVPSPAASNVIFFRVGTLSSKEEPLHPFVSSHLKKTSLQIREQFKRSLTGQNHKDKLRAEARKRAISKRYKIVTQCRGLRPSTGQDPDPTLEPGSAGALPKGEIDYTYFDAILDNESEDVITCNGVPLESTKYVYDVFFACQPVDWSEFMEENLCEIEGEVFEDIDESDDEDALEDEDDENDEGNWRNDYPDYDDSPYEDEEEYLNAQIRKLNRKNCESDSSYDLEDYEDENFDGDGNLIESYGAMSLVSSKKGKGPLQASDESDLEEVF